MGGNILYGAFYNCNGLEKIIIPDSANSIGENAFYRCGGLASVIIGKNVTRIGSRAFYDCGGLTGIIVVDGNATYHSTGNCLIETKTGILVLGCQTSQIPADGSVTIIGESAFQNCRELTRIIVPDGVTEIRNGAFSNCSGLESIAIPNSLKSIEISAFSFCSRLEIVYYKGTAEEWTQITIGSDTFYLTVATRYYYSESEPALNADGTGYDGNYWHYDTDGVTPVVWKKES